MISGDPKDFFPKRTKEQEEELNQILSALFRIKIKREEEDEPQTETSSTVGSRDQ